VAPRQDWDPPIGARVLDERRLAGEPEDLIFGPHPAYDTFPDAESVRREVLMPVLVGDTARHRGPAWAEGEVRRKRTDHAG